MTLFPINQTYSKFCVKCETVFVLVAFFVIFFQTEAIAQEQGPASVSSSGTSILFQNDGPNAGSSNGVSILFQNQTDIFSSISQGVTIGFGIPRNLVVSPAAGPQDSTTFTLSGAALTPNSTIKFYVAGPSQNPEVEIGTVVSNASGQASITYRTSCENYSGTTYFRLFDMAAFAYSQPAYVQLTTSSACDSDDDTALVPAYNDELGDKIPVILIHGLHGNRSDGIDNASQPYLHYFKNLILHLNNSQAYNSSFKTYKFHWVSDKHKIIELANALRRRIDNKPEFANKKIIIVTHSTGALIARQYLSLKTNSGNDPRFTNRLAGERVDKVITLAGPHHGTYGANGRARSWGFNRLTRSSISKALTRFDSIYWRPFCENCITNLQLPNRGSLLWDNFDGGWDSNQYYLDDPNEQNNELRILTTYNHKIIAYWGEVSTGNTSYRTLRSILDDLRIRKWSSDGVPDDQLATVAAYLIHGIKRANFSNSGWLPQNDGLIPVESARFDTPNGENWIPMGRVHCAGYNHRQLRDGDPRPCENDMTLFDSVLKDILGTSVMLPAMLFGPERAGMGYGTYSSVGKSVVGGSINNTEIELFNSGDSALEVTSLGIVGTNSAEFSIQNPPAVPFAIPAKGAFKVHLRFSPASTGAKSAILQVSNSSANPMVTIPIEGFGMPTECDIELPPSGRYIPMSGGSGNFLVGSIGCPWTVSSDEEWIHPSASGNSVNFTVDNNATGFTRDGVITVFVYDRPYSFLISQDSANGGCWINVSTDQFNALSGSNDSSFDVTTPDNCGWSVQSGSSWITLTENTGTRLGSGNVAFTVAANTSASMRYGIITIVGKDTSRIFTVTQPADSNNCTYTFSANEQSLPAGGGSNAVTLTTSSACEWRVSTADRWLSLTSANNGIGIQTINYSADTNGGTATRYGSIFLEGNGESVVLAVTQASAGAGSPDISLPSSTVNAGNALIDSSTYQSFLIQNNGTGYLSIGNVYVSAGSSDFEILPHANSLLSGESMFVGVKFTPTSVGAKNATISISSSDPDEGLISFDISGAGVMQAVGSLPAVNLPVASTNLADVLMGMVGESILSVQNTGDASLSLSYSLISGTDEISLFRTSGTLSGGQSGQIKVRIVPTSTGPKTATFRIVTNDPVTPTIDFTVSAKVVDLQSNSDASWQVTQNIALPGIFSPKSVALRDGKAYLSRNDNTLAVIELSTGAVQAEIPFTSFPTAETGFVAIAGNKAFVSLGNLGTNGQVAVVDRNTNTVSSYIPVGLDPVAIAANGERVYVSVSGMGAPPEIKVIDSATDSIIQTIPVGMNIGDSVSDIAIEQTLGRAYVVYSCPICGSESGFVDVIDLATAVVYETIPITTYAPKRISIAGNRAYLSTVASVEVIDLALNSVVSNISLPNPSEEIVSTPEYVLIANRADAETKLDVISTATNKLVQELSIGDVKAMAFDTGSNYIYAGTASPAPAIKALKVFAPSFSVETSHQIIASRSGNSTTFQTTVSSINGWAGSVTLSCEALPVSGVCQFAANPVNLTADGTVSTNVTVTVPAGTINGPYGIRVVGNASSTGFLTTGIQNDLANLSLFVPTCGYQFGTLNQTIGPAGGSLAIEIQDPDDCGWTTALDQNWLSVSSGSSGTGNGTIMLSVTPNGGSDRVATLTAAGQTITILQLASCKYSLNSTSQQFPASGGPGTIEITALKGCNWTAEGNPSWITIVSGGSGNGDGTVSYTVEINNGPAREAIINVADQTFQITQDSGCTYSLSTSSTSVSAAGGAGSVDFSTGDGCAWAASSNASWITISGPSNGNGSGSVGYLVAKNTGATRVGTITISGQTFTLNQAATIPESTRFDFDGDSKADISIFRPSVGEWWYLRSSDSGNRAYQFGLSSDIPVPADYTGDGITDIAFFRPLTGEWYVLSSETNGFYAFPFGTDGDIPAPGDFDGDGKNDAAVFRPSTATWYILRSSDSQVQFVGFGANGDKPVIGDYDNDGESDVAIFRPSASQFWLLRSTAGLAAYQFGAAGDNAFAADFSGDGSDDIGLFRPSTGFWYILRSDDLGFYGFPFGANGDIPAPADYDGDGIADATVFRPTDTTWYSQQSATGPVFTGFGANGDRPAANSYVVQ